MYIDYQKTENMNRLQDRVAIITGGASGIGKATAIRFAQEGAQIAIWDVQEERGRDLINIMSGMGFKTVFYKVDVSDFSEVEKSVSAVVQEFGRIDILINNAGILRDASLLKMTESQFDSVIDVNLKGIFNCTRAVAPLMVERRYGRIVQASSVVALYGNFGQTNYVASKAGIIGMTKVWSRELGRKGITVNAVAPGFIATEMIESVSENITRGWIEKVPLQRLGTVEEVANVYLFLASDEAAFVNGAVISVDGGAVT
jgi:3-oxoacyl-[acyl-carrier protein] reductase